MSVTEREYLSVTDTAKLLRAALKREWPAVKFSVRSSKYAGGASIDISWTDGPCERSVERVSGGFASARFDGMIDMATSVVSWLEEDGTAHVAHAPGTEGQRGSQPEHVGDPRGGGARLVHFGADYVHTRRTSSPELVALASRLVTHDGRADHRDRCDGCGDWHLPERCWVVRYEASYGERTGFVCSAECGGRLLARSSDESAVRDAVTLADAVEVAMSAALFDVVEGPGGWFVVPVGGSGRVRVRGPFGSRGAAERAMVAATSDHGPGCDGPYNCTCGTVA